MSSWLKTRQTMPEYIRANLLLQRFNGSIDDLHALAENSQDCDHFINLVFEQMGEASPTVHTACEDFPFMVLLMQFHEFHLLPTVSDNTNIKTSLPLLIVNVGDVWQRIDSLVDDVRLPTIDAQALMSQAVDAVERAPNKRTIQYFIDSFIQNHSFTKDDFEEHPNLLTEICVKLTEICNILSADLMSVGCYHSQAHELIYEYDKRLGMLDIRLKPRIHYAHSVYTNTPIVKKINDRFKQQP